MRSNGLEFRAMHMSLRWIAGLALVLACAGCQDEISGPCRDGLAVGDRYLVTLGKRVPTTPPSECPANFDLASGAELVATVSAIEEEAGQCASGRIEIAPFGDWTWSPDSLVRNSEGGSDLIGHFLADNGECTGRVDVRVFVGGASCERQWVPDDASGSCPASCYDRFDCEVTKAP